MLGLPDKNAPSTVTPGPDVDLISAPGPPPEPGMYWDPRRREWRYAGRQQFQASPLGPFAPPPAPTPHPLDRQPPMGAPNEAPAMAALRRAMAAGG